MLVEAFNRVQEEYRHIEHQRLMVDPGKIVIQSEFDKCSSIGGNSILSRFMKENHVNFTCLLKEKIKEKDIEIFAIPVNQVSAVELAEFYREKQEGRAYVESMRNAGVKSEQLDRIERYLALSEVPAMRLGDILRNWNEISPTGHALPLVGYHSLIKGEGQVMIDFWKAVNALKDYSDLFPGNRGGGKRISVPESDWKIIPVGAGA